MTKDRPQLQNLPHTGRRISDVFRLKPDRMIMEVSYSGYEIRLLQWADELLKREK